MLALLTVLMLGAGVAGPLWADQNRREREQDLLKVGALYARAILSYRSMSPGSLKEYPQTLEQLTLDPRFVGMVRHLRAAYPDPMSAGAPWEPIVDEHGRIVGVRSRSSETPMSRGPIDLGDIHLAAASHYSDWQFIATAPPSSRASDPK